MKHKHLTYEDRLIIQQEPENGTSLHKIAQRLHKCDSTTNFCKWPLQNYISDYPKD